MDYNVLDLQGNKKSDQYIQGSAHNQPSTCETSPVNPLALKGRENTLKLNNLIQNGNPSSIHMSTNSIIQLTKRNVWRDDSNTNQFGSENEIRDEEKENRYNEVSNLFKTKLNFL